MIGHTDRMTINQRRPLTENMTAVLRAVQLRWLFHRELSQSEKNAMKALADRGLVNWHNSKSMWGINDLGRDALLKTSD